MEFSLPLTAFEEYFVWDDRPLYPAHFFCHVTCTGRVNHQLGQRAIDVVSQRQPLSRVRLHRKRRNRLEWVSATNDTELLAFDRPWPEAIAQAPRMDLRRVGPIRIWVREKNDDTELIFQIHHAAFDGLGSFQLLSEWLSVYHALHNGMPAEKLLRRLDPEELNGRCRSDLDWRTSCKQMIGQWRSLRGSLKFLTRRTIPLIEPVALETSSINRLRYPSIETFVWGEQETSLIREWATERGLTVNALLMGALFRSLRRWQRDEPRAGKGTHFRIMVPFNERGYRHRRMPAANHCSMINFERRADKLDDLNQLLSAIRRGRELVDRYRLGLNFWRALEVCRWLPGGLKTRVQNERCRATCALTNLGDLFQRIRLPRHQGHLVAGNLTLRDFELVAPVRPGTPVAITVCYYLNRLRITIHYDSLLLTATQGQHLLDCFVDETRRIVSLEKRTA